MNYMDCVNFERCFIKELDLTKPPESTDLKCYDCDKYKCWWDNNQNNDLPPRPVK